MLHTAALPFVLRRDHGVIRGGEVTTTVDHLHGLLYLNGEQLVIQWRPVREVSHVGQEIRTDRELGTVHEVALPLSALADAMVRRARRRWWRSRQTLVLTAADLKAFDPLTGEADLPGLVFEHPAEIVLEVRPADQNRVREFVSELRLALSEHRLAASEAEMQEDVLLDPELLLPDDEAAVAGNARPTRAALERL